MTYQYSNRRKIFKKLIDTNFYTLQGGHILYEGYIFTVDNVIDKLHLLSGCHFWKALESKKKDMSDKEIRDSVILRLLLEVLAYAKEEKLRRIFEALLGDEDNVIKYCSRTYNIQDEGVEEITITDQPGNKYLFNAKKRIACGTEVKVEDLMNNLWVLAIDYNSADFPSYSHKNYEFTRPVIVDRLTPEEFHLYHNILTDVLSYPKPAKYDIVISKKVKTSVVFPTDDGDDDELDLDI